MWRKDVWCSIGGPWIRREKYFLKYYSKKIHHREPVSVEITHQSKNTGKERNMCVKEKEIFGGT